MQYWPSFTLIEVLFEGSSAFKSVVLAKFISSLVLSKFQDEENEQSPSMALRPDSSGTGASGKHAARTSMCAVCRHMLTSMSVDVRPRPSK